MIRCARVSILEMTLPASERASERVSERASESKRERERARARARERERERLHTSALGQPCLRGRAPLRGRFADIRVDV